jgi:hypothetical protein
MRPSWHKGSLSTPDAVGEFDDSLLLSPWWDTDTFQSSASLPPTQQVRGDPSGELPLRCVPQAVRDASLSGDAPLQVRPDAVEEVGNNVDGVDVDGVDGDKDRVFSVRCISGSGAI